MVLTESEGADHCGGISLGGAWFCGECTAQHLSENAERHFVPESEERHEKFGLSPQHEKWVVNGDACVSV